MAEGMSSSHSSSEIELKTISSSDTNELSSLPGSSSLTYNRSHHSTTSVPSTFTSNFTHNQNPQFSAFQNGRELPSPEKIITCEEDIEVKDSELPVYLKELQYDVVLIYCDADEKEAILFKDILENYITLGDEKSARVCTLDKTEYLSWIGSKFRHLEEAVVRSTYMFLFMSKNFVTDAWADLQKDECLQESIDNPERKWCVVPVHTLPKTECKYQTPWGLRSLKGLFVDSMLKGKRLSKVNFEDLTVKSLDPFFIRSMTKLLDCRLNMKLSRQAVQEGEIIDWKRKEEAERTLKLKIFKQNEEIREARKAKREQQEEEALQKRRQQAMENIEQEEPPCLAPPAINATPNVAPANTVPVPGFDAQLFKQCLDMLKKSGVPDHPAMTQAFQMMQVMQTTTTATPQAATATSPAAHNIINIVNSSGISIGDSNTQNIAKHSITAEEAEIQGAESAEESDVIIERTRDNSVNNNSTPGRSESFELDNASLANEALGCMARVPEGSIMEKDGSEHQTLTKTTPDNVETLVKRTHSISEETHLKTAHSFAEETNPKTLCSLDENTNEKILCPINEETNLKTVHSELSEADVSVANSNYEDSVDIHRSDNLPSAFSSLQTKSLAASKCTSKDKKHLP